MVYTVSHFLEGKRYTNTAASTQAIYNPALGEVIGEVLLADASTCEKAIQNAAQAGKQWALTTPVTRMRILFKFKALLEKYQNDIAYLVTKEHGKTLDDARGSIARAIEVVEFHCGLSEQLQGHFSMEVSKHIDCYTFRQPLGVCVGISPFNFPVMVPVWLMIPALAYGNSFILKPSPLDPSSSLRLMELLSEAGLPDGVANCLQGNETTVQHLITHSEVAAVTAVASTPVAETIYKTALMHGKRAHTFGGAKNHCVIMPDADMRKTANAVMGAAFGSAGERCMAISVVLAVGQGTTERLLEHLLPLTKAMCIDAGDAENADMGPLISEAHKTRVLQAIETGVKEGAKLILDGRAFKHPVHPHGFFLGPCIFDEVNKDMSIYQEEIFGPVLVIVRVESLDEALTLINLHQYGNGSAIFTRDGFTARDYCQQVQVGMVGVNVAIPVPVAHHPFGGWKRSAFGDLGLHARESVHFYTRLKTVTSKWFTNEEQQNHFAMPTHQ